MAYTRPGVYVTEGPFSTTATAGSPTVSAAFIGTAPRGPITPTKVNSWTAYKTLYGDLSASYDLPYAVYHYFANGGRSAYVSRVYNGTTTTAASAATLNIAATVDSVSKTAFKLTAANPGVWGNSLTATVSAGLVTGNTPTFILSILSGGLEVERWSELSLDPSANRFVSTIINNYSDYVVASNVSTYTSTYSLTTVTASAFTGGADGAAANGTETNTQWTNAVSRLDSVTEELLVNLVGMTTASVVNSAISYAENRGDIFVVIDPVDVTSGSDALTAVSGYNTSSYAAVYYPKMLMVDPSKSGTSAVRTTFPGGAILGLYSRVEAERTVAKAPAGYAYDLRGAFGLTNNFTEAEEGTLYASNVNTLKGIAGVGVIINGTRTLKKTDITKYIPVRRSLNYIKAQTKQLTRSALFEPNGDRLWTNIQVTLARFLATFWANGGLKGRSTSEAFYIICDNTNNTPVSIENGEVHIEVGVALQTPAEFIVINVTQFTGGTAAVENV
ncbi:COG3497 Phage tail sheath protein FI [uncultured Caudovirales phage]|uniref:COG3497 Phage tail sheath protein FI n=1 Tax=uncultured Caudovirales phage TaxID=2100421 RepID=A0A6J7X4M0_9CAUD|nr:COG3497 Phage tail sheath protein FI [uncultured Caudovirales phage]